MYYIDTWYLFHIIEKGEDPQLTYFLQAIQGGGTSPSSSTSSSGTSSAAKTTATSLIVLTALKESSTGTATANTNNLTPTQSLSGTGSAISTTTPKSSGARSVLSGDWPQVVTLLVVATVIGIRLVL